MRFLESRLDWFVRILGMMAFVSAWSLANPCALAQNKQGSGANKEEKKDLVETDKTLMNEAPFDLIYIKPEAGGERVRVLPIDFPNREVPSSPDMNGKLIVSLVQHPDRKYEVRWRDIEVGPNGKPKIILFEEQVLLDARRLMEEKEYAAAFEHLNYLMSFYPQTPGLAKMKEDFLFVSAAEMFAQQRLPHTLAVLEEYQRSYPGSREKQIRTAMSNVADQMVQNYIQSGDLRAAQMLLVRLRKDYASKPLDVVERWDAEFRRQASEMQEKAKVALAEGRMREARSLATQMLAIQPDLTGGKELLAEIIRVYPMMRIGVFQKSQRPDPTSLSDWAARRSGALVSRPLFQFRNTGPEGGDYDFSLGKFSQSDDRRELELNFTKSTSLYSPDVAEWLMARADPKGKVYRASWASLLQDIRMESPERLIVRLRKPHVLPHALLQWPLEELPAVAGTTSAALYKLASNTDAESSFRWGLSEKPDAGRPVEIVEKFYDDPRKAVSDMLRGEIDIIDQLFPSDAKTLRSIPGIKVDTYALPSIHMLVPRSDHRYLREATFRRALMYGINRQAVLQDEILGGDTEIGSQIISGPFPIGKSDNDQLSYAYNQAISPMPYDRTLSKLLFILAEKDIASAAARKKVPVPPFEKLKLGVPDVEFAKTAGEAFVQQWGIIGIPVELVVLPRGVTNPDVPVDLLYVTASIWEPATDIERLLGPDGVAATNDPFIVQALGTLRTSRNWTEVRRSLQDLHRLIDDHLPVLPLWQVNDALAYRTNVRGLTTKPMTLYQGLEKWRIVEEQR